MEQIGAKMKMKGASNIAETKKATKLNYLEAFYYGAVCLDFLRCAFRTYPSDCDKSYNSSDCNQNIKVCRKCF